MISYGTMAILKNVKTGKWHPILFQEYPMTGKRIRLKRLGFRAEGYDLRIEAVAEAKGYLTNGTCVFAFTETDIPWSGEGIPVSIAYLAEGKRLVFE